MVSYKITGDVKFQHNHCIFDEYMESNWCMYFK